MGGLAGEDCAKFRSAFAGRCASRASRPAPDKNLGKRKRMYQHAVDFIIVGAGSAGAALANRLTENGRHQVLLLEAGGETHPLSRVPISFARFINRPGV